MTSSKTCPSLLELFNNFSQGSYYKIFNQKSILQNKFMKRKLRQNLQFVIRSELKQHSKKVYLAADLSNLKIMLEIECKSE